MYQIILKTPMIKKILFIFLFFYQSFLLLGQPRVHDPSHIVKDGGRYWIFSTGKGISATSSNSTDFLNYQKEKPVFAFETWPQWINVYVAEFSGKFWAPDLIFMNNKWYLYYSCSTFGSQKSAIGLVTTTSLSSGVWEDRGMVTFTDGTQGINAIDPYILKDKNGKIWLNYGSFWKGIVITELDSVTGKPKNTSALHHIANNGCEASAIVEHNGYYYLFFNRGSCCKGTESTYEIFVGRSKTATGPFFDQSGIDCNNNGGTSFLKTEGRFIGPGHVGVCDSILTYHFYDADDKGISKLKVAKLEWKNDWVQANMSLKQ